MQMGTRYLHIDEVDVQKVPGRKYYEVNVRAAVAFREIGKGHQGLENFSRLMNMHGISFKGYEKIVMRYMKPVKG